MLRIHIEEHHDPETLVLRLEGKCIQPWGDELFRAWDGLVESNLPGRPIEIDLDAVSFVDEHGKAILADLQRRGCRLRGSGLFIPDLIKSLASQKSDPS